LNIDHVGTSHRWTVAQIGAREHFAVARALQNAGELRMLYTDVWSRHGNKLLAAGPRRFRSLAGRFHPAIDPAKVKSFNLSSSLWKIRHRMANRSGGGDGGRGGAHQEYVEYGTLFARNVALMLARTQIDPRIDRFFGFFTGCLETLEFLKGRGVFSVVDQADAARAYHQVLLAEAERWPGWQALPPQTPDFYYDRLASEWALASAVLVNSDYSRKALLQQGVDDRKIILVPVAFEMPADPTRAILSGEEMTFVWLGNVTIGKGIQYLIEAAKLLAGAKVRFLVAGKNLISAEAVASAPSSVQFLGQISRDQTGDFLASGHVLVFPTMSDGFGLTQLEAMAHGLPVIATENCGQVVDHEQDGLIIPAGNAQALAGAIEWFLRHCDRWQEMSALALRKAGQFGLERYRKNLLDGVQRVLTNGPSR
jgi:glycosyltransferase involved in cell wall biosynthesis